MARMKGVLARLGIAILTVVLLVGCGAGPAAQDSSGGASSGQAVTVEIVALEHPPVQAVLTDVEELLEGYGDRVELRRYDLETPEGEEFAARHDLVGHTPLALLIDGSVNATVNGQPVVFVGFPVGRGPVAAAEGGWTLDDLDAVIAERTDASS